jgi:hypothetical protein
VLIDVVHGCVREQAARVIGRPSPHVRAAFRHMVRIPIAVALAIVIAKSAWDLTSFADALGWLAPADQPWHWGLGLTLIVVIRALVAGQAAIAGEGRLVLRRSELALWLSIVFLSVVLERREQLYIERLPWNASSTFHPAWTDVAVRLLMPVMFLMAGTKAAAANIELIRQLGKRRLDVPTSILGLNR